MKIDINDIIAEEVDKLNVLFAKGAKQAGKPVQNFTSFDYRYLKDSQTYFGRFALPYFFAYSTLKNIEYRINTPSTKTIWYWKNGIDNTKFNDFLPHQFKLMYDTLNSYLALLNTENYFQALIIFRSYIEYSSQFYASLLDYDFFQKYVGSEMLEEDYKKLWFSSLKPAKVLGKIKSMHTEIDKLLDEKKIVYGKDAVYRSMFKPFDSHLRGTLYSSLSALAHGSYPALVKNDELQLYALVFLCSIYLIETQVIIDEISSVYFKYTPEELFHKWVTTEIYLKSRKPKASLFVGKNESG